MKCLSRPQRPLGGTCSMTLMPRSRESWLAEALPRPPASRLPQSVTLFEGRAPFLSAPGRAANNAAIGQTCAAGRFGPVMGPASINIFANLTTTGSGLLATAQSPPGAQQREAVPSTPVLGQAGARTSPPGWLPGPRNVQILLPGSP